MRKIIFCLSFFFLSILVSYAQKKRISIEVENEKLPTILNNLEKEFQIRFSYNDKHVSGERISLSLKNSSLDEILDTLNMKSSLNFEKVSKRYIIIKRNFDKEYTELKQTQLLKEIILNNFYSGEIQKKRDGSFFFSPKEIETLPGFTEPDIFLSIQQIPGVISPDESATKLYVRGGTPDQNLILWNDVTIYLSDHLYGSFSAFNPYITKKVVFINKGTNAKYGDRISSVIDVKTNEEVAQKFSGGFGVNLIDFDAYINTPIIKEKLSVELSGRRSFSDIFASNTYQKFFEKVFQHQNNEEIFRGEDDFFYIDYSLKINGKIDSNNFFNLSFINIENNLKSNLTTGEENTFNDQLKTTNQGYSLNYTSFLSPQLELHAKAYYSLYDLKFSHNEEIEDDEDDEEVYYTYDNSNSVNDLGISINGTYEINKYQSFDLGYNFKSYNITYFLSETNKNVDILNKNSKLTTHSLYTSYVYKNSEIFDLTGGIRLTNYDGIDNFQVEPRINLYKKINPHLSFQITAEKRTQAVSQINQTINQNLALENQIWALADKNQIPITKSWQFTAGFTFSKNNWILRMDTYLKEIEGITTLNKGFIDIEEFSIKEGESKILGTDLYIKKRFNDFSSSVSYTFSSANNNFEELNESEDFPTNNDITHNLIWLNEYQYKSFIISLGWRWHSGKPYSKAISVENDEDTGYKHLVYDGINTYRLSDYSRLDISGNYTFNILNKSNIKGKIGISILNILNNKNILERRYYLNPTNDNINTIETQSIQRVANLIFRVSW